MKNQILEAIESFGEGLNGKVSSPPPKDLFQVDDEYTKLSNQKSDIFHSMTAKLLYIEKRARPDKETDMSILTTWVSEPNEGNWKQLQRVSLYLQYIIYDVRKIGCDNLHQVFLWVDAV